MAGNAGMPLSLALVSEMLLLRGALGLVLDTGGEEAVASGVLRKSWAIWIHCCHRSLFSAVARDSILLLQIVDFVNST